MYSRDVVVLCQHAESAFKSANYELARNIYSKIIELDPKNIKAIEGEAYCLANLGNHSAAFAHLEKICDWPEVSAQALYFLGSYYLEKKNIKKAILQFNRSLNIAGDYFEALHDLAAAYATQGDIKSAYWNYQKALAFEKKSKDLYLNLGDLAMMLQKFLDARAYYLKAAELDQSCMYAWLGYGVSSAKLGRYEDALMAFERVIQIDPRCSDVWVHQGDIYNLLKRHDLAAKSYQNAKKLFPSTPFIAGKILHQMMLACHWEFYEDLLEEINIGLRNGERVAEPFGFQALSNSESDLKLCAKTYAEFYFNPLGNFALSKKHSKIKVGYICGEFRDQATSILMAGVYESHNKQDFEIYAFDNGLDDGSPLRKRIEKAFDHFIDIKNITDHDAAKMIAEMEIDILINLNGYFGASRQSIFAYKPAPIQVNYLGFPGTLGANYMDYLIADDTVIPPASYQHYCEKIVSLPNCYQSNDSKRKISDKNFKRSDFGLPDNKFIYCCFNNNYKITPDTFNIWMDILKGTENTVLWLLKDNPLAMNNLLIEAEKRGVSKDRIFFAERIKPEEHLERHQLADLFLDTHPYNAHTTASDAIWAGLPILTYPGTTFPGRVTSSLLSALGVPELIADSQNDYLEKAIKFAAIPESLLIIRQKLKLRRGTSNLFNTAEFTRNIEAAFKLMYSRYLEGLPAEHLRVDNPKACVG